MDAFTLISAIFSSVSTTQENRDDPFQDIDIPVDEERKGSGAVAQCIVS